ncbi:hypothetical protein N7510_011559 [Penicillium lagena]|uniref:uncharacterized protein n=1 Tax=Penicillium lagena TaxID=94218 RepID=UPI00253F8530|nr:uncharacterized protein N7510_011559 [Penicillium lagena]KAJ5602025.1 hypothetical protein N7510_011559 [Penicillium lagena]
MKPPPPPPPSPASSDTNTPTNSQPGTVRTANCRALKLLLHLMISEEAESLIAVSGKQVEHAIEMTEVVTELSMEKLGYIFEGRASPFAYHNSCINGIELSSLYAKNSGGQSPTRNKW